MIDFDKTIICFYESVIDFLQAKLPYAYDVDEYNLINKNIHVAQDYIINSQHNFFVSDNDLCSDFDYAGFIPYGTNKARVWISFYDVMYSIDAFYGVVGRYSNTRYYENYSPVAVKHQLLKNIKKWKYATAQRLCDKIKIRFRAPEYFAAHVQMPKHK